MEPLAPPVARLIDAFARLPGIGPKTASRLAFFLLRAPDEITQGLGQALLDLKAHTQLCAECFNVVETSPCSICANESRDHSVICVVEEPLDVLAIERTGSYRGVYHVLHGVISPIDGIGPEELKIAELIRRIQRRPVQEIILATNPGLEGDNTAAWIQRQLQIAGMRMTRLARGLPVGGDLEYADAVTLASALDGRSEMR
ncbi:recombination mediator RecR [Candidatus Amarolinea dominans]|jgi:recombination protein RecR|uniref:recombination mediator RecR n=1 Tax=Candidatus Amarolinea dominans TaxID=3140696 RepID=UPI001D3FF679|nr:recombination protein RecR [Anaerolineae bacterium]